MRPVPRWITLIPTPPPAAAVLPAADSGEIAMDELEPHTRTNKYDLQPGWFLPDEAEIARRRR